MATGQGRASATKSVSPAVIALAGILLVAFIGLLYYRNFGPPKPPPLGHGSNMTFVEKLAKQTGGDYSKLSDDDRQKLETMTFGHGKQVLADAYQRTK